jgi:hypothetical protein
MCRVPHRGPRKPLTSAVFALAGMDVLMTCADPLIEKLMALGTSPSEGAVPDAAEAAAEIIHQHGRHGFGP